MRKKRDPKLNKKQTQLRMYPSDKKIIKTKYGSVQIFFDLMTAREVKKIKESLLEAYE